MKIQLDHIYFSVSNMDRAVEFYEQFLNTKATHREGKRWADFEIKGIENKIIGFSIVNLNNSLGKAEIENIYVLPVYRKNGIGKGLVDEILKELRDMNYNNVNCLADEAIGFYEHYGFTKGKNFVWMDIVISKSFSRDI